MQRCCRLLTLGLVLFWPAIGYCQEGEDPVLRARKLLSAGKVREAAELFHREAIRGGDTENSAAWFNNACVLLTRAGALDDALEDCARAIELRARRGDQVGLARSLNNQALALQTAGRMTEAEDRYREALQLNTSLGEERSAVINLLNLGAVGSFRGDYDSALRDYREAEQRAAAADGDWTARQVFIAKQNQGSALESLDAQQQALTVYLSLLESLPSLGPISVSGQGTMEEVTISDRANLENNVGVVYRNLGDAVEAETRIRTAIELFEVLGDRSGQATAWLNLGLVQQLELGETETAIESLERALTLAAQSGDGRGQLQVLSYLMDFLVAVGDLERAEASLRATRALLEKRNAPESEWLVEIGAAKIAAGRGQLEIAIASARASLAAIERASKILGAAVDRSRFVEARKEAYDFTVGLLLSKAAAGDQEALTTAFETSLQAKERLLAESGLQKAGKPGGAEDHLFEYERIRKALDGAQLIELVRVGDELVRFFIGPSGMKVRRFSPVGDFEQAARRTRSLLAAGEDPKAGDLAVLSPLVADLEFSDRLFVSAFGSLSFFPWEVLPVTSGGKRRLVDETAVAMLPSAARLLGSSPTREVRRWLTVAVPEVDEKSVPELELGSVSSLQPLQFVDQETHAVAEAVGGRGLALEGDQATGARLIEELDNTGTRVVHIAAHTVIDSRPGGGASVLLEDGPLSARRLEASSIQVGLAVLAACSTQTDSRGSGRMLGTLTGAWLAAGADAVLATLWDVDDKTTLVFMQQFYYQLSLGLTPQAALASAKRRLRQDPAWRQPGLWSAYVLVGNSGPIVPTVAGVRWSQRSFGIALAGLAVLLALVALWVRGLQGPREPTP